MSLGFYNVHSHVNFKNFISIYISFRVVTNFIIFVLHLGLSTCNELKILSKTQTSVLEKYESYSDVLLIHLKIPEDIIFASFKFVAEETEKMSVIKFGNGLKNYF